MKKHPYLRRFLAYLVDWYLSTMLSMLPVIVFQSIQAKDLILINRIDNLPLPMAMVSTTISLCLFILYFCVIPLQKTTKQQPGQTFGRRWMKLQLVTVDGTPLKIKTLFVRDLIGILLLQGVLTTVNIYLMSIVQQILQVDIVPYVQGVYYLLMFVSLALLVFSKKHQMLHDKLSKTMVVSLHT